MSSIKLVYLLGLLASGSCDIISFTDNTTNRCYANYDILLSCEGDEKIDIFSHTHYITRGCYYVEGITRYVVNDDCHENGTSVVLRITDPKPRLDFGQWKCKDTAGNSSKTLQVDAGIFSIRSLLKFSLKRNKDRRF